MSNALTPHEEAVREWLIKADNDARSAKALSVLTPPILDTAGYHCQQAESSECVNCFV